MIQTTIFDMRKTGKIISRVMVSYIVVHLNRGQSLLRKMFEKKEGVLETDWDYPGLKGEEEAWYLKAFVPLGIQKCG